LDRKILSNPITSSALHRVSLEFAAGFPLWKFIAVGDLIASLRREVEYPAPRRKIQLDQLHRTGLMIMFLDKFVALLLSDSGGFQ